MWGPTCDECFAAPDECDPTVLNDCGVNTCDFSSFEGVAIASDGVVVVECGIYTDTGCGS